MCYYATAHFAAVLLGEAKPGETTVHSIQAFKLPENRKDPGVRNNFLVPSASSSVHSLSHHLFFSCHESSSTSRDAQLPPAHRHSPCQVLGESTVSCYMP